MKGLPLGPGGRDITWPDQVAPRGQRKPSTRNVNPQTSNRTCNTAPRLGTPVNRGQVNQDTTQPIQHTKRTHR